MATERKRTSKRTASKSNGPKASARLRSDLAKGAISTSTTQRRPKRVGPASPKAASDAGAEPDQPWQSALRRLYLLYEGARSAALKAQELQSAEASDQDLVESLTLKLIRESEARRAALALAEFERALGRAQRKGRTSELLDRYGAYADSPKYRFSVRVVEGVRAVQRLLNQRALPSESVTEAEERKLQQMVHRDRALSSLTEAKQLQKEHPEVVRGGDRFEAQPVDKLDEIMGQPSVRKFLKPGGGGVKRAAEEVVSEVLGVSPATIKKQDERRRAAKTLSWLQPQHESGVKSTKPTTVS